MKKVPEFICVGIFILIVNSALSQSFFRFKADFSIKAKYADGSQQLTLGTVFYDKTVKKIVYSNTFPEKETWVTSDTNLYKFVNNKLIFRQLVPTVADFSIYHLSLSGALSDYGLKNSEFTILQVEKKNGMVITTWKPPARLEKNVGNIVVSTKEKKLFGIVFLTPDGNVISKQFYTNYKNFNGLEFPTELLQITYFEGKESYEKTTYKNIVINESGNNQFYNFSLGGK